MSNSNQFLCGKNIAPRWIKCNNSIYKVDIVNSKASTERFGQIHENI